MGNPPIAARNGTEREPVFSFVEPSVFDPSPRLLVERLLYTRALLQSSPVLAPRFMLGNCAAAHHILLPDAAAGLVAADRLLAFGFEVEVSRDPPGIRFSISSSHGKEEIHALLVAIAIVVRELSPVDPRPPRN